MYGKSLKRKTHTNKSHPLRESLSEASDVYLNKKKQL